MTPTALPRLFVARHHNSDPNNLTWCWWEDQHSIDLAREWAEDHRRTQMQTQTDPLTDPDFHLRPGTVVWDTPIYEQTVDAVLPLRKTGAAGPVRFFTPEGKSRAVRAVSVLDLPGCLDTLKAKPRRSGKASTAKAKEASS